MLLELEYSSVLLCQLRDQEIELEVRIGPVYFHQAANRLLFLLLYQMLSSVGVTRNGNGWHFAWIGIKIIPYRI